MNILSPSILSADFANLGKDILETYNAGAKYLHVDVMDGKFVPSISFGMPVIKAIRKVCDIVFDVHLMIEEPIRYIKEFVEAGASIITVHAECTPHLQRVLQLIKSYGVKAGVALNPATPLEELKWVMDDVDMILIMTVNPGFGGQKLIPATIEKTAEAWKMIEKTGRDILLEVDGGVAPATCEQLRAAGANLLVAGSALYGAADAAAMVSLLRGDK